MGAKVNGKKRSSPRTCGLIMSIRQIEGCLPNHSKDVQEIFKGALKLISQPKFNVKLVSDAEESGIIHQRIFDNLRDCDIVIIDVSGQNPNVMFEFGWRSRSNKPFVVVKDDKTEYVFDIGIVEHLSYPRDLRYNSIVEFQKALAAKVLATYKKAQGSPFVRSFGRSARTVRRAHLRMN
jgi:hypothetical protein